MSGKEKDKQTRSWEMEPQIAQRLSSPAGLAMGPVLCHLQQKEADALCLFFFLNPVPLSPLSLEISDLSTKTEQNKTNKKTPSQNT